MKKTLLLTLALLLSVMTFAQSHVYLNETFDENEFPGKWTKSEIGAENWVISNSSHAGGSPNELMLDFFPPIFMETTRIISPVINLSSVDEVIVSFKHCLNNNIDAEIQETPYTIGIATSTDQENWNIAWSEEYKVSGMYEIFEVVNTPEVGQDNVYFSLFFSGSTLTLNGWAFDDIMIYSQDNLDLEMVSVDVPGMSNYGEHEISFTVQNKGVDPITSFEAKFETANQEVISETFEVDIKSLEIQQFTFSQAAYLAPGSYNLKVEITTVNGESDSNEDNNIAEKDIAVGMGYASKIPMIEHFSSSTCGYCVEPNKIIKQVLADNPGKYTYTKYPTKFPGMGDPYTTEEVRNRVNYYQVSGAPEFYLDGIWEQYEIVSPEDIDSVYGSSTYADVRGAFTVEGHTINITADFMSYIKMDSVRAFISVNEKTTTENVATNGETEFHHIMMKMLPDDKGFALNIEAGEYQRLEFSYNMDSTFMEDINDLEVALWLQNYETHEIYNSHYAYEYTEHCYPIQNMEAIAWLECVQTIDITWDAPEQGNPIGYNVYIDGELVAENAADNLKFYSSDMDTFGHLYDNKSHIAEVVALYEDGMTSVRVAKVIKYGSDNVNEYNEINCRIYPNPANDRLYIDTDFDADIEIYNINGLRVIESPSHQGEMSIDVSNLNAGVYFIEIKTEKGNIVKRFIKN